MTEKASDSEIALATALVPSAKAGNSKTPMGPFHTTVLEVAMASAKSFRVSGPMSRPIWSAGSASAGTTVAGASAAKVGATTVSTGSSSSTPLALAVSR